MSALGSEQSGNQAALDEPAWVSSLEKIAATAQAGCGLSHDLWVERLSGAVDDALERLPAEHHARALEIARQWDYATPAELLETQHENRLNGYCTHGIDKNCCPAGCGDLDDDPVDETFEANGQRELNDESAASGGFDEGSWAERLREFATRANVGCGQSYDLFESRFCGYIDGALGRLPPEHQDRALELARHAGYVTAAEMEESRKSDVDDGYCSHGIDKNCCPVGCGDRDDGEDFELDYPDDVDFGEGPLDAGPLDAVLDPVGERMAPKHTQEKNILQHPVEVLTAPVIAVAGAAKETALLLAADGELKKGYGMVSGVWALGLAILCFCGVLAFHFPQYLTTPELRQKYSVDVIRHLMFAALVISGSISLVNVILKRKRSINGVAGALVLGCLALGGSHVPVTDFPDHTPYIGLDWFILDLLGSTLIFVALEKLFPLYKGQHIFRKEWQTDLVHFAVNHFIIGLALLTVNFLIHRIFGWVAIPAVQDLVQALPFVPQLLLAIFVADLAQYCTHRAYHEVPFLWRFHAVHHSAKTMDWLAGSRMHILELICTRVGVLGALYVLGFEKSVMDVYIIVVGFQAVFNHANVHLNWGPLKYVIVTPDFHHWHHSSDDIAIDKNYSAHFSFIDWLFGTAIKGQTGLPKHYGVVGDYMPDGFAAQQRFPFHVDPYRAGTAARLRSKRKARQAQ